ncbi:hypothetical protein B0H14DRAFT_2545914 [Mycena olivaceomarginata]|nr:hypothetical protein B0H14DRAFT_2545914 [Mycena olivaceomarginata]
MDKRNTIEKEHGRRSEPTGRKPFNTAATRNVFEIYSQLFFSTRVTWDPKETESPASAPSPRPTLLRSSRPVRQVCLEIGRTWPHQILFSFEGVQTMLDKLTDIPPATRALIRHVRVSGDPLMVYWQCALPGLALDRLTILGPWISEICYDTLDMLVRNGVGGNELYFLVHDSTFLAHEYDSSSFSGGARFLRVPQPGGWQRALEERDGATSNASVEIYLATSLPRAPSSCSPAPAHGSRRLCPAGKSSRCSARRWTPS